MINHFDHSLDSSDEKKSGTIVTAYCSCIAGYVILIGAMDCVSMYECMLCTYACVYVCTFIVHMNVAMYVCNPSDITDIHF